MATDFEHFEGAPHPHGTSGAAQHEPAPTGDGRIVLNYVLEYLPIVDNFLTVAADLRARAEMGRAKYGTYLRENNGRDASVDLLQELYDAVMYCGQCRMEGKSEGVHLGAIIRLAGSVAGSVAASIQRR